MGTETEYATYEDATLLWMRKNCAAEAARCERWAAMCESAQNYEPNPETAAEWGKMLQHNCNMTDYYRRSLEAVNAELARRDDQADQDAERAGDANEGPETDDAWDTGKPELPRTETEDQHEEMCECRLCNPYH